MAGGGRHAVDHIIAGHDAFEVSFCDGRLEGLAVDLPKQAGRCIAVGAMDAALGIVEPQKVLRHTVGLTAGGFRLLTAMYISYAQRTCQCGILSVCFALTAHAGIPGDIQHRCKDVCHAAGYLLTADDAGDPFLQLRIPAGASGDTGGEAGRILNERAAQALHMENRRDTVRAVVHDDLLHAALPCSGFLQRQAGAHLQRADFTHPTARLFSNPVILLKTFIIGEDASQLADLLLG